MNYWILFFLKKLLNIKDLAESGHIKHILHQRLKVAYNQLTTFLSNLFVCTNYSIPVGKNNIYGHPNKEVLSYLEQSKIYRTDEDGSIMYKVNNNKLKIETCSP